MAAEELLKLKIRLLTEGATLSEREWSGRQGGAGPVQGRYFFLPNGRSCGVPIRRGSQAERFGSATLEPTEDSTIWLYDGSVELEIVPRPKFYDLTTDDGIPYHKIALLHGSETLATTVYQACRYWASGTQCKFCTIPHSYSSGATILEKTPEQVTEVVKAAENEGAIRDVLLTTGTPETPDMGCSRLIRIIEGIRESSEIPIGVQFEPPTDMEIMKAVFEAGANAAGIHAESADESVRKEMCPGKHEYGSLSLYHKSWAYAVELFGPGNVSTFLLHGIGESIDSTLELVNELGSMGVLSVVTPMRPAPGSQLADFEPAYLGDLERSVEFYKRVGKILLKWKLDPDKTAAGCHRCGGCTPIQEAYDWAKAIFHG